MNWLSVPRRWGRPQSRSRIGRASRASCGRIRRRSVPGSGSWWGRGLGCIWRWRVMDGAGTFVGRVDRRWGMAAGCLAGPMRLVGCMSLMGLMGPTSRMGFMDSMDSMEWTSAMSLMTLRRPARAARRPRLDRTRGASSIEMTRSRPHATTILACTRIVRVRPASSRCWCMSTRATRMDGFAA